MARLEVKRHMGRADIAYVSELLAVATRVDGHSPLGEHKWLDLVQGGLDGFTALVAWEAGHDHPVGYAQLSRGEGTQRWAVEYVVDPHHRSRFDEIARIVLDAAIEVVRDAGGGRLQLWVPQPRPEHDSVAAAIGLHPDRELRQLRRPLPAERRSDLPVRAFVPGQDEEAWLAVNNRAFAGHGEQGDWDLQTLCSREAQPWFDPSGFLLHERDGRLAGFCWTKIHPPDESGRSQARDRPLGELYVIAVDPDFQGLGLGRELALAGLNWLQGRVLTMAMLYVDAENKPAVRLYEDLGFALHHIDRAYAGDIPAAG